MKKKTSAFLIFIFSITLCFSQAWASRPSILDEPVDLKKIEFVQEGKKVLFSGLLGKPMIVCYGADWCPSCHKALPAFDSLSEQYQSVIRSFVVTTAQDGVYKSMTSTSFHLETFGDDNAVLRSLVKLKVYPTFLFIDEKGFLVATHEGSPQWSEKEMNAFLNEFIQKKGRIRPSNEEEEGFASLLSKIKNFFS